MNNEQTLNWKRLAPGMYEARIGSEDLDRYLAVRIDAVENHGYGLATSWALTYPGSSHPDSMVDTYRTAKAWAQADAEGGNEWTD